jgi:exopolysaccharide biosynthesis polyprenyl glycosylphosphotransferase
VNRKSFPLAAAHWTRASEDPRASLRGASAVLQSAQSDAGDAEGSAAPSYRPGLPDVVLVRALPALVVGALLLAWGQHAWAAVIALAALVWLTGVLERYRCLLRLMPVARAIGFAAAPAIAVAAAMPWSGATVDGAMLAYGPVVAAGWMTMAIAAFVRRRRGRRGGRRIAVVGSSDRARMLQDELARSGVGGYHVCGYVDLHLSVADGPELHDPGNDAAARALGASMDGVRLLSLGCLGHLSELRTIVIRERIDLVVVDSAVPRMPVFDAVLNACLDLPVRLVTAEWLYERLLGHVPIGTINASWFQCVMHPLYSPSSPLSKRLFDIVVASLSVIVLMPLFAIVALAIMVLDGRPILYRQLRLAEGGRTFPIVKFRTMGCDAEQATGAVWSRADENRSTRIGALLRRTHLDELPQLFNVLAGHMSMVGPRPERPEFLGRLVAQVPFYAHRGIVKPGITGWAQVRCGYAGSDAGTAWKMAHDLFYLKHRTVLFDLLILLETIRTLTSSRQFGGELGTADFIVPSAPVQALYPEQLAEQRSGTGFDAGG